MNFIILYSLIIPTIIISIIAFQKIEVMDKLKFNAVHIHTSKEWYRFLSYGTVHANYLHLGVNMYVFWSFGKYILFDFHYIFGQLANLYFTLLYIPALALSVVPSYLKNRNNVFYNAVGASGAVSAIVYVSIILNPMAGLGLILIPIYLPAWIFGALYLIYTIIMSKRGNSTIGHSAHLWGAVYGLIFILLVKPSLYLNFFEMIFN